MTTPTESGVAVAQLGARMHYAVPVILARAGVLNRLFTDFYWPVPMSAALAGAVPKGIGRLLGRRTDELPSNFITSFPVLGLRYYARVRRSASADQRLRSYLWAGSSFNHAIIRSGLGSPASIYAYNSSALELFQHAKEQGVCRILEQTIAPKVVERRILEVERSTWAGWETESECSELVQQFADRERQEWELANLILCGSDFVRDALVAQGVSVSAIRVVPYGVDRRPRQRRRIERHGRLKVLFVGAVGLRKGVPYLIEAARALCNDPIDFRVIGELPIDRRLLANAPSNIVFTGPMPHASVREEFESAEVFVLPSLCEGSATVCYEALSAALPVITTPNAGSVVRHGVDGYIVPTRNSMAIADRLRSLASDRELLQSMSESALERSSQYNVAEYGQRLMDVLRDFGGRWSK